MWSLYRRSRELCDVQCPSRTHEHSPEADRSQQATSTPSGARHLGVELDPSLEYAAEGFRAALDYAVLVPGAAFDNPMAGLDASAAQLVRLRLGYVF